MLSIALLRGSFSNLYARPIFRKLGVWCNWRNESLCVGDNGTQLLLCRCVIHDIQPNAIPELIQCPTPIFNCTLEAQPTEVLFQEVTKNHQLLQGYLRFPFWDARRKRYPPGNSTVLKLPMTIMFILLRSIPCFTAYNWNHWPLIAPNLTQHAVLREQCACMVLLPRDKM